ncbi:MAG TPA: Ku protein [Gemmataceae bacterium]|nr:Ku protein [Gemmataceae bacterium]
MKAFSVAVAGRGRIGFHLVHAKCGRRIHYEKVCPVHGEVGNDEIVKGYEQSKGEYTLLDKAQLAKLRPDADKSISLDAFVAADAVDPIYYGERAYYLTPEGRAGEKPYAVLQRVMADEGRCGVATMVFSGREQLALVRPLGKLLVVHLLQYEEQVKKPAAFEEEIGGVEVTSKELDLARSLVDASTPKEFDLAAYRDEYSGRLLKLIESKAGRRVKADSKAREAPVVINLMDALRQSLDQAGRGKARRGKAAHKAPARARRKTG